MAKIIDPRLFSQQFGVPKTDIDKAGFLDPLLNADTKLFIDPLLLRKSGNATLRTKGVGAFRKRTSDIVNLLMVTPTNSGPAWTAALRLLDLQERRETRLGYGGAGRLSRACRCCSTLDRSSGLKRTAFSAFW
ncbi:hypothetical protein AC629_41595 [Bradyrhizobium sp. NAS80.1]|uniref:hypothetical protein n=1 Tax=Bradyrhizobium sp. NAS80.1 TaxID=1680159 RepID=UPI0009697740|nr:hypothetical protein [Bradyrhizobium sp. NAS80.1]OKO69081.1 hypothetical protein AC629_41595 [Bradyrhizobium sp. NAS80.1]